MAETIQLCGGKPQHEQSKEESKEGMIRQHKRMMTYLSDHEASLHQREDGGRPYHRKDFELTSEHGWGGAPASPITIHTCWCHMVRDIALLLTCDTVFLIPTWTGSRGAKIEHSIATFLRLEIIYLWTLTTCPSFKPLRRPLAARWPTCPMTANGGRCTMSWLMN